MDSVLSADLNSVGLERRDNKLRFGIYNKLTRKFVAGPWTTSEWQGLGRSTPYWDK
jgi:hypothetical protein